MAAPAFESFAVGKGNDVTSQDVSAPSGSVDGDHWLAVVWTFATGAVTHGTPTDWTNVCAETASNQGQRLSVWQRFAPASPGTTTFPFSGTTDCIVVIARTSGAHATSPVNASGIAGSSANSNPAVCPSVTTLEDDCTIFRVMGANNTDVLANPGTLRWNQTEAVSAGNACAAGATATQASAGSTGTADFTLDAARPWVAATIAIAPPVGAIGQPTMRRWGGVPYVGGQGIGNKGSGRMWGRRRSGIVVPRRFQEAA